MEKTWKRFKKWYFGIPGTKQHLEVLIAFLTILLFTTTLLINIRTLQSTNKTAPTSEPNQHIVVVTPAGQSVGTPIPTADSVTCKKGIGSISIDSPSEGETITDNPVCIGINYQQGDYCSSVWQYRLNGGEWSSFSNDSPCFYNVPSGNVTFELNVKSLVSSDTTYLKRTFEYQGSQTSSTSATLK